MAAFYEKDKFNINSGVRNQDSTTERKFIKKLSTIKHKLLKDGIDITQTTSQVICVSNAGLGNGVSAELVRQAFSKYGSLCDIIMLPRKPYAFVCYNSLTSAREAVNELNGSRMYLDEDLHKYVVIYTLFVTKVPPSVMPSTDLPEGLIILPDFISHDHETQLLHYFDTDVRVQACYGELKHRYVRHFGYEFLYNTNNVDPSQPLSEPIPTACDDIIERLLGQGHIRHRPDQLTVNRYLPGQGIPPHVDTAPAFEDGIVSVSLASQVVMEFRHPDGRQLSVLLPRRSAMVMTGASRYIWSHGITPRKSDIIVGDDGVLTLHPRETRVSLTLRKVVKLPAIHNTLDVTGIPSTNSAASHLENHHVHQVYSEIAHHYSATRHTPWPLVASFIHNLTPGIVLLDVGCGNGKYFGLRSDIYEIGCERSAQLAGICGGRGHEVCVGDTLALPLRSSVVDVCICIAVLHHLSTYARRLRAIEELCRVMRPGGQLLVQVWAVEQTWGDVDSKYISKSARAIAPEHYSDAAPVLDSAFGDTAGEKEGSGGTWVGEERSDAVPTCDPDRQHVTETVHSTKALKIHKNRTPFQQQDLLVPWCLKGDKAQTFHRFYHIFKQDELEGMCANVEGLTVEKVYYDEGNWCIVCRKS